jgi:hypothetical protein
MKNNKLQLQILKNLIKEEIKLHKIKMLNEDLSSTEAADVASGLALGEPELLTPIYSNNGLSATIINVKGYKILNLIGFDEFYGGETQYTKKESTVGKDDIIKINWTFEITQIDAKSGTETPIDRVTNIINANTYKLSITYNKELKSIDLIFEYGQPDGKKVRDRLHGAEAKGYAVKSNYKTDELLEILKPKNMNVQQK